MTINSKTAQQIKRLQDNLVDRDGIIRVLKAENHKLNRDTIAIRRVLKVLPGQPVNKLVVKKSRKRKKNV